MKQYMTEEGGCIAIDGMSIPPSVDNRHYAQALAEVSEGKAEILPYVKPVNEDVDKQIVALEGTVTLRRIRESMLTSDGKVWLQDVDDQIEVLRTQRLAVEL